MSIADWAEFKEQVRSRTDLVSLIAESRSVTPRRGGREYVALCPFHDDRNPSLTINPERQTYKCWSCQAGGDCYSYVMEIESVDFRTALEMLAKRAGLELPQQTSHQRQTASLKDEMYAAIQWAKEQFHQCLLNASYAEPARDYLSSRGFHEETWSDFQLGFVPDRWDWLLERSVNKFKPQVLEAAQLIRSKDGGRGHFDFFRHRLMFPIFDTQGRAVAFGGRVLPGADDANGPKYLNSPDSEVFHKSHLLYALHQSREEIRRTNTAIVVEGYTDCIALHQAGMGNVVAALGTALVETHVSLLKRFCTKVVLVFDGDDPGQNAADRSIVKFIPADLDVRILTPPDGLDPAEYIATHGIGAFQGLVDQAPDVWDFKFQRLLKEHGGQINSFTSQKILDSMLEMLSMTSRIQSSPREDRFISQLCMRVGVQEATARKRLAELRREQSKKNPESYNTDAVAHQQTLNQTRDEVNKIISEKAGLDTRLDCEVLELLLSQPYLADAIFAEISPGEVHALPLQALLQTIFDAWEEGQSLNFDALISRIEETELKRLVVWLSEQAEQKHLHQQGQQEVVIGQLKNSLQERREKRDHLAVRIQTNPEQQNTARIDNETTDLLRRAAEFHAKRATRKKSSA